MRILHIVKYYHPSIGGMETVVKGLSEGLLKRGIECTVLTANHEVSLSSATEYINNIKVHRTGCAARIMSQPVTYFFGNKIKELSKAHDIVHLHSPFPNAEVYNRILAQKPLLVTWHADPSITRWKYLFPFYKPVLHNVLKNANEIVATSSNMLKLSSSLKKYENKCSVIPLAFSSNLTNNHHFPRTESKRRPTILFVGLLRPYKGVKYLIRAIGMIANAKLVIIGQGEEEKHLRQMTKKLALESRVVFLNKVSNEEIVEYYKNADIFVLPSVSPAEAFGIVQLEAMSFGLPVINTDLPSGVPSVSLHDVTGITVRPRDSHALALAIQQLIDDPELYKRYSANALARSREFTEDKMIDRYCDIYKKIIKKND